MFVRPAHIVLVLSLSLSLSAASVKKKKRPQTQPVRTTVATRSAALSYVQSSLETNPKHIENPESLFPFFQHLAGNYPGTGPIHVLQYGDSHTASDDWADSMRKIFQDRFGDGGAGFTLAGYPFRGYRRFDIAGGGSSGWTTTGTSGHPGDHRNGLAGLSIETLQPGAAVTITTSAKHLELMFLHQPGGGTFTVSEAITVPDTVSTDGPFSTGRYKLPAMIPGDHTYTVTTLSRAPVRLFGWIAENNNGLTWETLGINGAQARSLLEWDQDLWTEQLQVRKPALIVLAYGTNEALYPKWTPETYRADLLNVIGKFRTAVPDAALLIVGPPDCGHFRPFPFLRQVIQIQREAAKETGSAFWDWSAQMNASGGRKRWVQAGLSQPDYTHLTAPGYRVLGRSLAQEILWQYQRLTGENARTLATKQEFF